jgi:mono/diheme cytochrome c family protein
MTTNSHEQHRGRGLIWAALMLLAFSAALSVLLFSGCSGPPEYPPNLSFPTRNERLVLKLPEPPTTDRQPAIGWDDTELARLDTLGGKTVEPSTIVAASRTALDKHLRDAFGTPAAPTVTGDADVNAAASRLGLAAEPLKEASRLFRKQCQQCHNLAGDGRGPASNVVPPPRDFRRGMFKFTTTGEGKPRRSDLLHTLNEGLKGSAMPSFGLLPEAERDLLARFATYLSIRGQVEFETLALLSQNPTTDVAAVANGKLKAILAEWDKAENAPPLPGAAAVPDDGEPGSESHAAAVRRGFALFTAKADNACITCHGDFGRKPQYRFDVWGSISKPADLTANNVFKGGKRPEDVFARIRGGIPAVGMPAHPEMTDRQVWDLVRFAQSIPYPRELPPDVRSAVYP